jgi:hypothetical protein
VTEDTVDLRARLAGELGPCEASDLVAHAKRSAVILVNPSLELLEVAVAIAKDEKDSVAVWMSQALLLRPTLDDIAAWEAAPATPFVSVIVRPFVLVRGATASKDAEA